MLSITNNSIKYQTFVYTVKWSRSCIFNYSIQHKSFVCTQFKYQTVLFDLWWDPIRSYHSEPEWTWERCQWSFTPHSLLYRDAVVVFYSPSRLGHQYYRWWALNPLQRCSRCILHPPADWANYILSESHGNLSMAERSPTTHLLNNRNKTNKTCGTLLEK